MSDQTPGPADLGTLPFFAQPTRPATAPAPGTHNAERAAAHLTRAAQRQAAPEEPGYAAPVTPPPAHEVDEWLQTAPATAAAFAYTDTLDSRSDLPWEEIAIIRDEVSRELAAMFSEDIDISLERREEAARDHITDRVRARVDEQTRRPGAQSWTPQMQSAIKQAVFDHLFRLGRLQPLVDEPEVENIHINGFDDVWISYADGRVEKYKYPIASSDRELEREINLLAARSGEGGRSFTSARPRLHMDLPGGARLAAVAEPHDYACPAYRAPKRPR